jgi:predicted transcriptional regulator
MAAEDSADGSGDGTGLDERDGDAVGGGSGGAGRAVDEFDRGVVDLLTWLLDTEARARIYVYLRRSPDSTSSEIAEGADLYPSTVREALAELHEEAYVTREKRENAGAGNNPYEYEAIAPGELVRGAVGEVQAQLNTVFDLDRRLTGEENGDEGGGGRGAGPVSITVDGTDVERGDRESVESTSAEPAETARVGGDGGRGSTGGSAGD